MDQISVHCIHGVRIRNGFVSRRGAPTRETYDNGYRYNTVRPYTTRVIKQYCFDSKKLFWNRFQTETVAVACYGVRRVHLVL